MSDSDGQSRGGIYSQYQDSSTDVSGYISIKDYAYDESNPLHYGYYEDEEDKDEQDESYEDYNDGDTDNDKRQSVVLPSEYIVNRRAVAQYDFKPENDNELGLSEGDVVFIGYRHGQGWLVAENSDRTRTGLVPEEFVLFIEEEEEEEDEEHDQARPFYLTQFITQTMNKSLEEYGGEEDYEESNDENDQWEDINELESNLKDTMKISE